ncbi:MAG: hypothetical protein KC910_26745 [Candidatus Eremiobacteraeota bacterium]|nr:hypothetical protein [Candidatus Eremiobacteraeota bacterium]
MVWSDGKLHAGPFLPAGVSPSEVCPVAGLAVGTARGLLESLSYSTLRVITLARLRLVEVKKGTSVGTATTVRMYGYDESDNRITVDFQDLSPQEVHTLPTTRTTS